MQRSKAILSAITSLVLKKKYLTEKFLTEMHISVIHFYIVEQFKFTEFTSDSYKIVIALYVLTFIHMRRIFQLMVYIWNEVTYQYKCQIFTKISETCVIPDDVHNERAGGQTVNDYICILYKISNILRLFQVWYLA